MVPALLVASVCEEHLGRKRRISGEVLQAALEAGGFMGEATSGRELEDE